MTGALGDSDPELGRWSGPIVQWGERHTDFAESAQGVATDGRHWYVVSNRSLAGLMRRATHPLAGRDRYANLRRVGVYDLAGRKLTEVVPAQPVWAELVRRNRAQGWKQEI